MSQNLTETTPPGPGHEVANAQRSQRRRGLTLPSKESLLADLSASVVVFLVALPLCMGVAIASGVPAELGLITGIVGGIVAGAMPGSSFVVSGPAAGLTVLVYSAVTDHGVASLGAIVLLAGLIQLVMGVLRMGQWFRAISLPVVHGMLAGIGVLIVAGQLFVLVDDKPSGEGLENILNSPTALHEVYAPGGTTHAIAALLGILTIILMLMWGQLPKKFQVVPSALVGVATATLISVVLDLDVHRITVTPNLLTAVNLPTTDTFRSFTDTGIIGAAVAFALIASAESLLSATAVDRMHDGRRTQYDAELRAQGVGNTICGVLGALPMTGVIVRSAANVKAGARTRLSTILHGVWILAAVALLTSVLNLIPTASLAGVLLVAGAKLIAPKAFRQLWSFGWMEVAIYLATIVAIVMTDLLKGVIVGLLLSMAQLLWEHSHLLTHTYRDEATGRYIVDLHGAATFVQLPKLAKALESVPAGSDVQVKTDGLRSIDPACRDFIESWQKQHSSGAGEADIEGPHELARA